MGASCLSPQACGSGFCVDGICCTAGCTETCHACAAALTGGVDGTCAPVLDGAADPRGGCPKQGATSCAEDGTCSAGACHLYAKGTPCDVCTGLSTLLSDATCNGAGTCVGTTTSCGAYACDVSSCYTSCTGDAQCSAGDYCLGSVCTPTKAAGVACSADGECTSGACGGGYCCASACADQGVNTCGTSGQCAAGTGACELYPAGSACASCASGTSLLKGTCNGAGTCQATASTCPATSFCWQGACGTLAAIAPGSQQTCAVTSAGAAQCWGYDFSGQLGDKGTEQQSDVPVAVVGLSTGVVAVATSQGNFTDIGHSCALTKAGAVLCWGWNGDDELGAGIGVTSDVPVPIAGLPTGNVAITAGAAHTCVVTAAGGVLCWGGNGQGQLGDGTANASDPPVAVSGLASGVAAIAAGERHTCALTTAGAVWCWGFGSDGELGNGTTTGSLTPVPVAGLGSGVVAIAAGRTHTCAVTKASGALCWGDNGFGQLGNGTTTSSSTPVPVMGLTSGVSAIAAGADFSCAVQAGAAKCWGSNGAWSLGNGLTASNSSVPVQVTGLTSSVTAITAGGTTGCALTTGGGAWCWGTADDGQLGGGSPTDTGVPVAVTEP